MGLDFESMGLRRIGSNGILKASKEHLKSIAALQVLGRW